MANTALPDPSTGFMSGFMQGFNFLEQVDRNRKYDERAARELEIKEAAEGRAQWTFDNQQRVNKAKGVWQQYQDTGGLSVDTVEDIRLNPDSYGLSADTISVFENYDEVLSGAQKFSSAMRDMQATGRLSPDVKAKLIEAYNESYRDTINRGGGSDVVKRIIDAEVVPGGKIVFTAATRDTKTGDESVGPVTHNRSTEDTDIVKQYTIDELVGAMSDRAQLAATIKRAVISGGGAIPEKSVGTFGFDSSGLYDKGTGDVLRQPTAHLFAPKAGSSKEDQTDKPISDLPPEILRTIGVEMKDTNGNALYDSQSGLPIYKLNTDYFYYSQFHKDRKTGKAPQPTPELVSGYVVARNRMNNALADFSTSLKKAQTPSEFASSIRRTDALPNDVLYMINMQLQEQNPQLADLIRKMENVRQGAKGYSIEDVNAAWEVFHPAKKGEPDTNSRKNRARRGGRGAISDGTVVTVDDNTVMP